MRGNGGSDPVDQGSRGVLRRGLVPPDYRGRQLSTIVPILSRAYAFTYWNMDYLVAMMSEDVVKGGMTLRTGYTNIDWEIRVSNSPLGNVRFAFMWMAPPQLLQDIAKFVARFEGEPTEPA